jgi:hypothetical protein
MVMNNNVAPNNAHINWKSQPHKKQLLHNIEEQLFYSMPHKNGDNNLKKD